MTIDFFEPPPSQRTGGLDGAIEGLRSWLTAHGYTVRQEPQSAEAASNPSSVAHFHGLWRPQHLRKAHWYRNAGIPYVVSPHGMLEPWAWRHKRWKKWPYFRLLEKPFLEGAQSLLATSDQEARNLRAFFPLARCEVIPLGLTSNRGPNYQNAREGLGWGRDETVLLFLSRIHPKKGLDLLLGALAKLKRSFVPKPVRLVIVGGGESRYENMLKQRIARDRDVLPDVDWVGEIWSDLKWLFFQGADLFCLPSHSENFGLSVLEALQVGTRVLTTNQTPWAWIEEWEAGWVTSPSEAGVESALRKFFERPRSSEEERRHLSDKIHDRFSWERIGPQYLRLYEELAKTGKTRCR